MDYTYDFVTVYGAVDTGNQVLCYAGNNVQVQTVTTTPSISYNGKTYKPVVNVATYNGIVTSPRITEKWSTACANYYSYKTNGTNFNPYYTITQY